MKNYWSMFKDWALWLASPTLGVSLFMSPSLLLSFLQLLVKTAHGNDATNSSIYNIIRWVAWTMGQMNRRPSVWCSKFYFFFMTSCKILCKNPFNSFSYFFYKITNINIKSFEFPKFIKSIKNNNTGSPLLTRFSNNAVSK